MTRVLLYPPPLRLFTYILIMLTALNAAGADALKAEDLLQKHLESIGTVAARTAAKTRVVQGTATYKLQVG